MSKSKRYTLFFSWQSDEKKSRQILEQALNTACDELEKKEGILYGSDQGRGRFFDPFLIKGLKYPVRNKSH